MYRDRQGLTGIGVGTVGRDTTMESKSSCQYKSVSERISSRKDQVVVSGGKDQSQSESAKPGLFWFLPSAVASNQVQCIRSVSLQVIHCTQQSDSTTDIQHPTISQRITHYTHSITQPHLIQPSSSPTISSHHTPPDHTHTPSLPPFLPPSIHPSHTPKAHSPHTHTHHAPKHHRLHHHIHSSRSHLTHTTDQDQPPPQTPTRRSVPPSPPSLPSLPL